MAKNRNKKKRNGVVSMDTTDLVVSEQLQAMDTSESGVQNKFSGANIKMKQKGRPMKRSKNVRKMKAIAKAVCANEKSTEKMVKNESKKDECYKQHRNYKEKTYF